MNVYGRSEPDQFALRSGEVDVNGAEVRHSGIETTRIVTLGGSDEVQIALDTLASVVDWWDPLAEG